jgi:hypothetical protein
MSFTPVVPFGGYAGWTYLKRTMPSQQAALAAAPERQRDEAYFRQRIGSVATAAELVADRRLLKVALGAFGLEDDIGNRFFIRKVLEEGTLTEGALALRLADPRYREMSEAFGFGNFATPNTRLSDFADRTLAAYATRQFEAAVGRQSETMRLALNAEREVAALAAKSSSGDTKWYAVMGSKPLRQVFETALGLPSSFAAIDLDQQLAVFKAKAEAMFGTGDIAGFAAPERMEKLIRTYVTRADLAGGGAGAPGSAALQLLRSGPGAAAGLLSLLR